MATATWPPIGCPRCSAVVPAGTGAYGCPCGWTAPVREGIAELGAEELEGIGFPSGWMDRQSAWEDAHAWAGARSKLIGQVVIHAFGGREAARARRFLEVGCGVGTVLAHLSGLGLDVTGCETTRAGLVHTRRRAPGAALLRADLTRLGIQAWYDAAGLFDVLEHLDDEAPLLAALRRALRPGGRLFVTVPAYAWLFGLRDRIGGHRRRYTAAELRVTLERNGFRVRKVTYFGALLLPLLAALRLRERLSPPRVPAGTIGTELDEARASPIINALVRYTFALERALLLGYALPAGTSVLAVAERPA